MEECTSIDKALMKSSKIMCPLVRDPQRECYCYDMTSQKIPAALYYCSGKFEECIIHQRIKATRYSLVT